MTIATSASARYLVCELASFGHSCYTIFTNKLPGLSGAAALSRQIREIAITKRERSMINRVLLLIVLVFLILPSAGADSARYDSSNCLAFPAARGFFTDIVRIVMRASGALEVSADIGFKACKPLGEKRISLQRLAAYSRYSSEITIIHSRDGTSIPLQNITTESADPPILGGGRKLVLDYVVSPLLPGDETHETIQVSVPPILSGNQFWVQGLPAIQDTFAYKVMFGSERSDVTVRLVDPAKFLTQVRNAPDWKEWQSDRPKAGVLTAPLLEITTLGDWTKVAQQFRAAYFMDSQNLNDLRVTSIQPADDPEILFKQFTDEFGAVATSEFRTEPRKLSSILQTKGGDCKSLTFLLVNLLRWSGIDAELVLTSERHEPRLTDVFSFGDIDHVLVYVPSLDRYFDPALPAGWQQQQLNRAIRIRNRIHVAARPGGNMLPANACADYCILTRGSNSDPIRVKTETIRSYRSP
jgi:hypothetical protein